MNRYLAAAIIAALFTAAPAAAQSASSHASNSEPLSAADKQFLNFAAEDNQAEIQLCLLAQKRAMGPAVKAFARLMVDDHVEIESRLAALADGENVELPNGIGQEGQERMSKLEPLKGAEFDRAFIQAQIQDHTNDLKKFTEQERSTRNAPVRQFAAQTIPILDQHLELAKAVETRAGHSSQTSGAGSQPLDKN